MNEKYDEFGHRVEYMTAESERQDKEAVEALEETIQRFEETESKNFNRKRFEQKSAEKGRQLGRGTRSLLEFAGDSLGLVILKNSSRRDLAYKVIKGSRKLGEAAESVVDRTVREGGRLLGSAAEQVDVDYLKERAEEVKADLTDAVKESEVLEKVDGDKVKSKARDLYQSVSDKVREGREHFSRKEDPEDALRRQQDLEERITAFEKLYEEEAREEEIRPDCYTPEEFKETK